MDVGNLTTDTMTRDAALARVLAYRERGRTRPTAMRATLAIVGYALLVVCIPLMVLLPEAGIPALLIAFRILAVEADWAAHAYAWTDWRFVQLRAWFHRQSGLVRAALLTGLLLAAARVVTRLRGLRAYLRGSNRMSHCRPQRHHTPRPLLHDRGPVANVCSAELRCTFGAVAGMVTRLDTAGCW